METEAERSARKESLAKLNAEHKKKKRIRTRAEQLANVQLGHKLGCVCRGCTLLTHQIEDFVKTKNWQG